MEPPERSEIHLRSVEPIRGIRTDWVLDAVAHALAQHGRATGRVDILLTDDRELAQLNSTYRGQPEPTDVLSFPSGEFNGGSLGDVAISLSAARRQALARKASLSNELTHLAVHGALHLLGFDDRTTADRSRMQKAMAAACRAAGVTPDAAWESATHA
jgi:rRNA maturation RNase YbeY